MLASPRPWETRPSMQTMWVGTTIGVSVLAGACLRPCVGHVSVGARVVRSGGEGLYGRSRSPFPFKNIDPTTNTWSCIELVFSGAQEPPGRDLYPRGALPGASQTPNAPHISNIVERKEN